jgi:kynurenine formamidase
VQHLNLTVADLDRSAAFYSRWFGFDRPPRIYEDGTAFLADGSGFDLALHPGAVPSPPADAVHFGFRRAHPTAVRELREAMQASSIPVVESHDEVDYVSLKCLDPDGYVIEVYWEPPVPGAASLLVDLSHEIESGMVTYPGLPAPSISDHLSREASRAVYAPGTEFQIGRIDMVANTGTYLDTPAHRYADGFDLSGLPLEAVAGVPGVCINAPGPAIGPGVLDGLDVAGRAVLFATGWDRHWRTDEYGSPEHPFLTTATVDALVERGAAVVGIDSVNIDDTRGGERVAHTGLLAAGIPIVEHLTGLSALVGRPFRFFAVPPKVRGLGTFPVRAFAILD